MAEKKKILVVDDSAFMRRVVSDIINSDNRCEVIGTANNGKEGLELAEKLKPDVITLDVQMPIMSGLEMLRILNKTNPIPVVMLSTLMKEGGKETMEALELGAYDFIKKPDNIFRVSSDDIKGELIEKVLEAADSGKRSFRQYRPLIRPTYEPKTREDTATGIKPLISKASKVNNLVALGTSTGGPKALQYVLPYLPANMNAGMVIVQHMPVGFTKSLSDRLNQLSEISIKEAEDKDIIENGKAYIAPGDKHLEVKEDSNGSLVISLTDGPPRGGHKPAVNVMLSSIADNVTKKKLIGVIMTGMGADGMEGMLEVKNKQKMHIIAQNEETCVVYGMPKSVVEKGIADEIVPLERIADAIIKQSGVL